MRRTKILITKMGEGGLQIKSRGDDRTLAVMLMTVLVTLLHRSRSPGLSNEDLANGVRRTILRGLEELSNE